MQRIKGEIIATSPLPFASIENEYLRVDYLTTAGPRITGLHAKGVDGNLFAETPDAHWPTPHGEYYLHGGHRLWVAPEDPFYMYPEDQVTIRAENDRVTLKGGIDPLGLEKEISFCLDENRVLLRHQVTWHGKEPIELAAWAITQLRLGGMAILPQPTAAGLQPNRKVVFWPYSKVGDARLKLYDDLILLHGQAAEQAFKTGNNNQHGWIACLLGQAIFVKRFTVDDTQNYPDMGCNVEAYVKDVCLELETLGPLRTLKPSESVTHEEIWEVIVGEYPATLERARSIGKQLSLK
jgi:hypothetical protein